MVGTLSFADSPSLSGEPPAAFDRFYFNLHGESRSDPFLVLGGGLYPPAQVVDAYVCVVTEEVQRSLRLSDSLHEGERDQVGPLRWQIIEPMRAWRLRLGPNPIGLEFDVTWTARTSAYEIQPYEVVDESGSSWHAHYYQSGVYEGRLAIDGVEAGVSGWYGTRDRSRGHRRVRDRLGMHQWVQMQFEDHCIGFLFNEDRFGRTTHCDGAVMHTDGRNEVIADVTHDLVFGEDLELHGGRLNLRFVDGSERKIDVVSTGRGIYMSGGGYGGFHGQPQGANHVEHDHWPLDGTRSPRTLDYPLVDALCEYRDGNAVGQGIFEYGITRSTSYSYRPTIRE